MAVTLPRGWSNFQGGGSNPDLCGEPQTPETGCPNPPCFDIPPIEIETGVPAELSCSPDGYLLNLVASGGVPPFTWETTGGTVEVTGVRTAAIDIGPPEDNSSLATRAGRIAFFKPHAFTHGGRSLNPDGACGGATPNFATAVADVRLRGFDCLKRHIPDLHDDGEDQQDNIYPDFPNPDDAGNPLSNPIGDNPADRTCDLAVDWPVINAPTPSTPLSNPDHFSVSATGCTDADPGNASVHVTAQLAGKTTGRGTIHSGAPDYDETKNLPMDISNEFQQFETHDIEFLNYMDVRTAAQVETGCCVIPAGSSVVVTATDARGEQEIIVIPVVVPA